MSEIKIGTILKCPGNHKIGVFNAELKSGMLLRSESIDFELGQECIPGDPCRCKICGEWYFRGGSFFTENGWMPREPIIY